MTFSLRFEAKKANLFLTQFLGSILVAVMLMTAVRTSPLLKRDDGDIDDLGEPEDPENDPRTPLPLYYNETSAWNAIDAGWKAGNPLNQTYIFVLDVLIADLQYDVEKNNTTTALSVPYRLNSTSPKDLVGVSYKEYRIESRGDFIKEPKPIPYSCAYRRNGTYDVNTTYVEDDASRHVFVTVYPQEDVHYGDGFNLVQASIAARENGYETTRSNGYPTRFNYPLPPGIICQLWGRTKYIWQIQQSRSCTKKTLSVDEVEQCSDWGNDVRGESMVYGIDYVNLLCGDGNVDPTRCTA